MVRKLVCLLERIFLSAVYLSWLTHGSDHLPTIFWHQESPALHPTYWSEVVNVNIFQTLTFLCPNNDVSNVPFRASDTKSYYNLYVRELSPNDTKLDYNTVCDPKKSRLVFFCNKSRNTILDFAKRGSFRQLSINLVQAQPDDPEFTPGMDYIFFSTSNGMQSSLKTKSTKCTMVFRIHFCESGDVCPLPKCSTYGRDEVCKVQSALSDAPRDVRVTANDTTSLSISWKTPLNTDNAVAYYSICYRKNMSQSCEIEIIEGEHTSAILKNLHPSTKYFIRVRAISCKGPGNYSVEISHVTQDERPSLTAGPVFIASTTQKPTTTPASSPTLKEEQVSSEPKMLTTSSMTSSSVSVTWKRPDVIVGEVTYYGLCVRVIGGLERECETMIVEPRRLSAVVYGLQANTSYGIRVRAHNSFTPGNYSKELIIRTNVSFEEPAIKPQFQSSCSESTIHTLSLVIGIIIGAITALAVVAVIWLVRTKARNDTFAGKPPILRNISNRGFLSSVSGMNTLDKRNDPKLNCTMELTKVSSDKA